MGIFLLEVVVGYTSYSLLIIPYAITPFIAYTAVEFMISVNTSSKENNFTSVSEVENYILSLLLAAEKVSSDKKYQEASSISECYLLATLDKHTTRCEAQSCICRKLEEKTSMGKLRRAQISKDNWVLFAGQQLNEWLLKFPKEPLIHVVSASFDFYYLKNYFRAIHSLDVANELNPPIPIAMTTLFIQRRIEEAMISYNLPFLIKPDGEQSKLDPVKVDKTMKLFNQFMEMIDDCTTANVSFWSILLSNTPNIPRLNRVGIEIFEYLKQLHALYNKIMASNSSNITFLYKYGVFLKFIIFDDITAEMIFNKIKLIRENKVISKSVAKKSMAMANELITLRVSGNPSSLGKILDANSEAVVKLKYNKDELKHSNISQLMSSVVAEAHTEWVKDAYARFLLPSVNKVFGNFVCDKNGYFTYANLLLKILPNLKEDINFILIIQLNRKMANYLEFMKNHKAYRNKYCVFLCSEKGRIVGINENMGNWLRITPAEINNRPEVAVETLLPEIFDNSKVKDSVMSVNGYRCVINYGKIMNQLSEDEQIDHEDEAQSTVSIWIRGIEETYGAAHSLKVTLRIFIIIPSLPGRVDSSILGLSTLPGEIVDTVAEKTPLARQDVSHAGSVASSSYTNLSNKNLVYEFKASLYDKKTPRTILLLNYVMWGFYLLLFASATADWILSYMKANDSWDFFDLIIKSTERMNSISSVSIDARTLDLHIRDLEENTYYRGKFYEMTLEHVFYINKE